MQATFRPFAAAAAALLSATVLSACGGAIAATNQSDGASERESRAAADRIIEQAVGDNPQARSGRISGSVDVDIDISGLPLLDGQTQMTADGVYALADGASVPDLDIDVSLRHNEHTLAGAIVLDDRTGYVKLGTTGYKVPDDITHAAHRARGRRPQRADEARRDVLHQPAGLAAQRAARRRDDDRGRDRPAHQGRHQPAGVLPRRVADGARPVAPRGPTGTRPSDRARAEAARRARRSVTVAEGEAWIGKDDHVLRKARARGKLVVAERDRDLLYGLRKGSIAANLDVSEVGDAHTIAAPHTLGSYSSLQLALSALAKAVRKDADHR